eukprot:Em0001g182a
MTQLNTKASKLCGTEDQLQVTQTKLSEATAQLQLKEEASSVATTSELKAELNKREKKISQLEETTASLELVLEQANVASLQAELQEVKRKGEVAVTSLEAKMSAMEHKSDHLEARLKEQLAKAASLEKCLHSPCTCNRSIVICLLHKVIDEGVWEEPAEGFSWSVHYLKCWTCFLLECIDSNGSAGTRPPSCQCRGHFFSQSSILEYQHKQNMLQWVISALSLCWQTEQNDALAQISVTSSTIAATVTCSYFVPRPTSQLDYITATRFWVRDYFLRIRADSIE